MVWTGQAPAISTAVKPDSQSVCLSVSPPVNAMCCWYVLLQPNKIMWPTFGGGTFRGQLLLEREIGAVGATTTAASFGFIRCQSFVLQCPNDFIDLPSTFVKFGVLHTLRGGRSRSTALALGKPTTLTSLISGMRGNVALGNGKW